MISATVTGNVGRQPELRNTRTGKSMATFSVASTYSPKVGEPTTTWVDVVCFDEQADIVSQRVNKGDRVVVTGRMELQKYQRSDGSEGASLRMVADEIGASLRWGRKDAADREEDAVAAF